MSHHHSHHPHTHSQDRRTLAVSFGLILCFMAAEFTGGRLFGSLALTADAGHMANDAFSLGLALCALYASPAVQNTLAKLNALSLIGVAVYIFFEAYQRSRYQADIQGLPAAAVAALGLAVNLTVAVLMRDSNRGNPNIRAAYLHVLTDLFGSIIAIAAALSAHFAGIYWVDTAASVLLALFTLRSGVQVWRQI